MCYDFLLKEVIFLNKIKCFIKNEMQTLKSTVSKTEYILWWVLRIAMVAAIIYKQIDNGPGFSLTVLILGVNLLATFTVTLIRLLLFPKKIVCRLPFTAQRWINIIVFVAAFLGHTFEFNNDITSWDKAMHFMSGAIVLLLGNELTEIFIRKQDRVSNGLRILNATGFSFFGIVVWEVYEFILDYNWPDSTNMAYNCNPDRDPFFVWLYGGPSVNFDNGLASVFDTLTDMICAIAGIIPAVIFLYFYLKRKEKKTALSAEKEEITA